MILARFRKDPRREAGAALFSSAALQARRPDFYADLKVPDSVEGRFDLLALHVFLIIRRIKGEPGAKPVAQSLVDAFFASLDDSLREMGVGDLSVGKKVRAMAEAFYGRSAAYETALAGGGPELAEALARNVYGAHDAGCAAALEGYVRAAAASLAAQPSGRILSGIAEFPAGAEFDRVC